MKIAFPTNNKKTVSPHIGLAKGFLIVDTDTGEEFYISNPVMERIQKEHINLKNMPEGERGLGTGRTVPPMLAEAGVDILVSDEFGEGMLRNLEAEGIMPYVSDKKNIVDIIEELKNIPKTAAGEKFESDYFNYPERGFGFGRRGFKHGFGGSWRRGFGGRGFGYARGGGRFGGFGRRRGWED